MRIPTTFNQHIPECLSGMNDDITASQVKEYFDVSVYRNILDMLQTLEARNWELIYQLRQNAFMFINAYHPELGFNGMIIKVITGFAVNQMGATYTGHAIHAPKEYLKRLIWDKNIPNNIIPTKQSVQTPVYNVYDLLNISRQIEWEMNRVRLPVPHNFRQMLNQIQGKDYRVSIAGRDCDDDGIFCHDVYTLASGNLLAERYINLVNMIKAAQQIWLAKDTMIEKIRKEIDAANLAKKVQEETIRKETEALITRQQAEEQAKQKELEILAAKKAAYEKELNEAQALTDEIKETKKQLESELKALQDAKNNAVSEQELLAVHDHEKQTVNEIIALEQQESALQVSAKTAVQAANNLNSEIQEYVEKTNTDTGVPENKNNALTPVIIGLGLLSLLT